MTSEKVKTERVLKNDTTDITQYQRMQLVLSERKPVDTVSGTKGKINRMFNKFLSGVSLLAGKKEENDKCCPYRSKVSKKSKTITIDCKECSCESSFEDENCRKNIFHILQKEPVAERLTLSKLYERDYEGRSLATIYLMSGLKDKLISYKSSKFVHETCDNNAQCRKEHADIMNLILESSGTDPLKACYTINKLIEYNETKDPLSDFRRECVLCRGKFTGILSEMESISKSIIKNITPESSGKYTVEYDTEYGYEYEKHLISYVRPPFSTSRIYTEAPDNTIFLECYDISYQNERKLPVNIYQLADRPEKMYMISPIEYSLEEKELKLIERIRKKMIMHRPVDLQFADPANSREYFRRLSKQLLLQENDVDDIISNPAKLNICSDLLTKYTTGLGILEDLLSDERVTDVYVNAPADRNPVHVVLDGEECITNIYLSQEDMESMVSRLRSISGRPFGEATPVLEMFLSEYK